MPENVLLENGKSTIQDLPGGALGVQGSTDLLEEDSLAPGWPHRA